LHRRPIRPLQGACDGNPTGAPPDALQLDGTRCRKATSPGKTCGRNSMLRHPARIGAATVLAIGLGAAGAAQADDFTIGGAFDAPNDVLLIEFSHPGGGFLAFTSQWNGGFAPDGPVPPPADPALDGFDAQLQLFIGTGPTATFDTDSDDNCQGPPIVAECIQTIGGTTFTAGARDSLLNFVLPAGDYTLGLTNYNNDSAGLTLGDGYDDDGDDGTTGEQGFTGTQFRVHLIGIGEILNVDAPSSVSISGPFDSCQCI
jgi:hypothetical protein